MTLTKDNLITALVESNGYPRNQAVDLVDTLIELIKSKLVSGENVLISGFGKFCVKEKGERRGRNPATGEEMMLARSVQVSCGIKLINLSKLQEFDFIRQISEQPFLR